MKPKTSIRSLLAALVIVIAGGQIANAQTPVTVPDFSFENHTNIGAGGNGGNNVLGTNWSDEEGNGFVIIQSVTNANPFFTLTGSTLPPTGDGTNFLDMHLNLNTVGVGNGAYCWQDIGALLPNTTYTLTIAAGLSMIDINGTNGQGFISLVNDKFPFNHLLATTFVDNSGMTPGTFADYTVVYTTGNTVSGDLTIGMVLTNSTGEINADLCFDNVRLTKQAAVDPTALPPSHSMPVANPTALFNVASSSSLAVNLGSVVTLSENPAGTGPFTYQWQTDNGSGGTSFSSIPNATNANYVLTNTAITGSVEYRAIVTNSLASSSTSAPVTLAASQSQPFIVQDTLPALTPSDVVGSSVAFSAVFGGDLPMTYQWQADYGAGPGPITGTTLNGTTNSTLTLTNLQVSDTAVYSCVAANDLSGAFGTATSTGSFLTVNPVPAADVNGVIIAPANQYGLGSLTEFTPSWTLATTNLIGGLPPSFTAPTNGSFTLYTCGGTNVLTDGALALIYPQGVASPSFASCGNPTVGAPGSPFGAGSTVAYTLPASANGWDITNIVVYGGWSDGGRDQQSYDVSFSTPAAPTNFNGFITTVNYLPAPNDVVPVGTTADQSATRITITSTNAGGVLAHNVAGLEFFFGTQAGGHNENGWEGYAEIQVFGTISAPAPVWVTNMVPATAADVVGSSVTMYCVANFSLPLTYQWAVTYADGHGTGSVTGTAPAGTTSPALTLVNLQQTDSGTYTLLATNVAQHLGLVSQVCSLLVNPAPVADAYGVIDSPGNQTGYAAPFPATWTLPSGDLIAGVAPIASTPSTNSFRNSGSTGLPILTDGAVGFIGGGNDAAMASAGGGSSTGQTITYSLPASALGYNISSIEVFGGWNDRGRDEQVYTIFTSPYLAPSAFNPIISYDYPAQNFVVGSVPNMSRVVYTPASGPYLAYNATNLLINFVKPGANGTSGGENGWQGYSEIAVYGTPASALVAGFLTNMVPATAVDMVGSSVTMYCAAYGTALSYQWQVNYGGGFGPVTGTAPGGTTSSNLTLTSLQFSDTGTYQLVVTSGAATITSLPCVLTVNSANPPDANNVTESVAYQNGNGIFATFSPSWSVAPGSLIAGKPPVAVLPNINAFTSGSSCAGLPALTDGTLGFLGGGGIAVSVAACGHNSSAGSNITYALTGSQSGFDLTNITVYGGWNDGGRDEQAYTISYSTVTNPTVFTVLTSFDTIPSPNRAVANYERVTLTPGTPGTPLITNAAYLRFDFSTPNNGGENGWQGYAEISVYGTPSATVTTPPYVTQQTLPSSGFDVVGNTVGFTAAFNSSSAMAFQWQVDTGTGPVPVSGARFLGAQTTALTITSLQLGDTGSYSCVATVSSGPGAGIATTTPSPFVVNAVPAPVGGVIAAEAAQTWNGVSFTPTWAVTPGSIIAGTLPTSTSTAASFTTGGCGGLPSLTDGLIGPVGGGSLQCFASAGTTPAGSNTTYTFGSLGHGYDLSSIVVYGGWQDNGRDEQSYTISYATAAATNTFITLETLNHTAQLASVPNSTRMTFTPGAGAFLAQNVAAVRFNFASPSGQINGWEGYSDIEIFGTRVPTVNLPTVSGGNLILSGTGGTPGGGYTVLTSTNVAAPLPTWTTNLQTTFDGNGSFSTPIPIVPGAPAQFFEIRVP